MKKPCNCMQINAERVNNYNYQKEMAQKMADFEKVPYIIIKRDSHSYSFEPYDGKKSFYEIINPQ